MTFSVIGTGNVAWFIATRLTAAGHECTGIYGRNTEASKQLAAAIGCICYGEISGYDGASDICFFAVSDGAIEKIAKSITVQDTVLVHTAGALPIGALAGASPHGGILWPIYSISKNDLPKGRNIPCAWEATSDKARALLLVAGAAISDNLFEAEYEQRKWLHVAAVIGNNFTNHLMDVCERICAENNLPFAAMTPILQQTFERVQHASPQQVQTGPAIRHDSVTVNAQMALLEDHPAWQRIYHAITASIQAPVNANR
ncbi:MAG: DUF2520 domain-containing protein [Bacteroidota bacterium]